MAKSIEDLTEEQIKFLEECEIEFKDRYTEKDKAFMQVKNAAPINPPAVHPWHQNKDSRGDNRGRSWRGGGSNNYRDRNSWKDSKRRRNY